jgi:hypothetical protein
LTAAKYDLGLESRAVVPPNSPRHIRSCHSNHAAFRQKRHQRPISRFPEPALEENVYAKKSFYASAAKRTATADDGLAFYRAPHDDDCAEPINRGQHNRSTPDARL